MIKSITNFLIIFFIFQQLKSQISQIDQNGYNAFCDETLPQNRYDISNRFERNKERKSVHGNYHTHKVHAEDSKYTPVSCVNCFSQ